jgi:manganese-dependent inorganic pyrophosphatase
MMRSTLASCNANLFSIMLCVGVAGMLLCAILSDTLNLMGPTTTDWDRMMVAVLCQIAQVKDINALVKAQFKAKSKELESKYCQSLFTGTQYLSIMYHMIHSALCNVDTFSSDHYPAM